MQKEYEFFTIISGNNNILISAPHTYFHKRKNKKKKNEVGLLEIINILSKKTNSHFIYTNKDINYDPNFDKGNIYQKKMIEYIKENNIEYVIDLHGMSSIYNKNIEIGTNYLKNINYDSKFLEKIISIFKVNSITKVQIDKNFKATGNTIANTINSKTNIKALQIEINKKYRINKSKMFINTINALTDIILYLQRTKDIADIDYEEKYDKVLDIKPAYGYEVKLGEVPYNHVGLEIEVAVHYTRNNYSFIKKMLVNIKNIVGDNGYFVKDGTIQGEYSFEIVLKPMSINDIYKIYSNIRNIVEFSNGIIDISKESNCGIHLNFNKGDIKDLKTSHKKITMFTKNNPEYFDTNIYKKFKFNLDVNKYIEYQKTISNKYVWINYLKNKVVEIRNIKADISPDDLSFILSKFILYFYEEEYYIEHDLDISQVCDLLFEENNSEEIIKSINSHGVLILKFNEGRCNTIPIDEEITNFINTKEENNKERIG